jgi:hypothetical protein
MESDVPAFRLLHMQSKNRCGGGGRDKHRAYVFTGCETPPLFQSSSLASCVHTLEYSPFSMRATQPTLSSCPPLSLSTSPRIVSRARALCSHIYSTVYGLRVRRSPKKTTGRSMIYAISGFHVFPPLFPLCWTGLLRDIFFTEDNPDSVSLLSFLSSLDGPPFSANSVFGLLSMACLV